MNGREKRLLKSKAKVRPVDLKIGKLGLSENFLKEAKKIIKKDGMIKFVLPNEIDTVKSRRTDNKNSLP